MVRSFHFRNGYCLLFPCCLLTLFLTCLQRKQLFISWFLPSKEGTRWDYNVILALKLNSIIYFQYGSKQDVSGRRWKERGIGWIFSQKQEVKSVAGRYSVYSDSNLIAVEIDAKDLLILCILTIISNCLFSQSQQVNSVHAGPTHIHKWMCSNQLYNWNYC